jgi:hypothetical protein
MAQYDIGTNFKGWSMSDYNQYQAQKEREAAWFNNLGPSAGGVNTGGSANNLGNAMIEAAKTQAASAEAAARIQADAANKALEWQKEQYGKSEEYTKAAVDAAVEGLNPWREAGITALGELVQKIEAGPGDYTQSPGYAARLAEGQRAIERSAAARGGVLSGGAVKAATRYGQEYATNDYDNFMRRYYESLAPLENLSGVGANASQQQGGYRMQGAANLSSSGQNAVNQMTNTAIYSGESTASGIMNSANIMAAQLQAQAEKDYAYNAWKRGEDF